MAVAGKSRAEVGGQGSENPGFVDRDSGFEKATFCRLHTWKPQSTYKHGGVVYVISNCAYWKIQRSEVRGKAVAGKAGARGQRSEVK